MTQAARLHKTAPDGISSGSLREGSPLVDILKYQSWVPLVFERKNDSARASGGDRRRKGVADLPVGVCLASGKLPSSRESLKQGHHRHREMRHADEVGWRRSVTQLETVDVQCLTRQTSAGWS